MEPLLVVIATWVSIHFGLPATGAVPRVEVVPQMRLAEIREARLSAVDPARDIYIGGAPLRGNEDGVHAMYDGATKTIYLQKGWSVATPGGSSLLVHEMVHYLQDLAGEKFACAGEREKMSYRAQQNWLKLFDRSLEQEFQLDAMTIKLRTSCFF